MKLIHANDSLTELGSHVDRHWHIGREGFKALVSHPALKNVNMILETPGRHAGPEDKNNFNALRSLRKSL